MYSRSMLGEQWVDALGDLLERTVLQVGDTGEVHAPHVLCGENCSSSRSCVNPLFEHPNAMASLPRIHGSSRLLRHSTRTKHENMVDLQLGPPMPTISETTPYTNTKQIRSMRKRDHIRATYNVPSNGQRKKHCLYYIVEISPCQHCNLAFISSRFA